jgi:hypothetical protein
MGSKLKVLGLAAAIAALVLIGPASATLAQLLGNWTNVDSNTRDIVRNLITDAGGAIQVQAWGACSPTPCDWGTVKATPYAPNVSSPLPADAQYLQAEFTTSFSVATLVIGPAPFRIRQRRPFQEVTAGERCRSRLAAAALRVGLDMSRKSGTRFCEKDMLQQTVRGG